ncbi:MAG: hypothetical protein ACRDCN_15090 [Tannerellaceae bacterium]
MNEVPLNDEQRLLAIAKELNKIVKNVDLLLDWLPTSPMTILSIFPFYQEINHFRNKLIKNYYITETLKFIDLFFVTEQDCPPIDLKELKNELSSKEKQQPKK